MAKLATATTMHRAADAVTVHSMGGLGNQLFIYCAGLAAAKSAGCGLRVDVGRHSARADRPPLLESLGFPGEYVNYVPKSGKFAVVSRLRERCTLRECSFVFDERVQRQSAGGCLSGYFQSWRYVALVDREMRSLWARAIESRSKRDDRLVEQVRKQRGIVLHVRRGDYLADDAIEYHGLVGLAYYRRAVGVLRASGFDGPLFMVSDDVERAVAELSPLGGVTPVRELSDPVDVLRLMSAAPAMVMANSSLSWWGAWLGDAPTRPVIAPRPWFDDLRTDMRDLLFPHWLTIGRELSAGDSAGLGTAVPA